MFFFSLKISSCGVLRKPQRNPSEKRSPCRVKSSCFPSSKKFVEDKALKRHLGDRGLQKNSKSIRGQQKAQKTGNIEKWAY